MFVGTVMLLLSSVSRRESVCLNSVVIIEQCNLKGKGLFVQFCSLLLFPEGKGFVQFVAIELFYLEENCFACAVLLL